MKRQPKWQQWIPAFVAALGLIPVAELARAQDPPPPRPNTLLSDIGCIQPGRGMGLWSVAADVVNGREGRSASAFMGQVAAPGVFMDELVEVVCTLPRVENQPVFRKLFLSFGFGDNAPYSQEPTAVKLKLYRDGQFVDERVVKRGEKAELNLDLGDTRSLAITQECQNKPKDAMYCPNLYFFEEALEPIPVMPPPIPPVPMPTPQPPRPAPAPIPQTW